MPAAAPAEIQDTVEEILSPAATRVFVAALAWRGWLVGLGLAVATCAFRPLLARTFAIDHAGFKQVSGALALAWPAVLLLLLPFRAWARSGILRAGRAFNARFAPASEERGEAFRYLLQRWHEQPAARELALHVGTAPGRSGRWGDEGPGEERVFAVVAPLHAPARLLRAAQVACGLACGALMLYAIGARGHSVWAGFAQGAGAAILGWLVLYLPAERMWRHRLDAVRARWNTRFAVAGTAGLAAQAALARVSFAIPAAADLLDGRIASGMNVGEPAPAESGSVSRPGVSLGLRLSGLGARLPLRLPRPARSAARAAVRSARLPDPEDHAERQRGADLDSLLRSLRRLHGPHVLILCLWFVFPVAVWIMAASAHQHMSFWRVALSWLLMGFALAFPSMSHRSSALGRGQRGFRALFPAGSPGETEAMESLEGQRGVAVVRDLLALLRPPAAAGAQAAGPPVEQAVREALEQHGIALPSGQPLPSAAAPPPAVPAAPAPAPRAARPARSSVRRPSGALPLVLPDSPPRSGGDKDR